jgi:hypothetical protein
MRKVAKGFNFFVLMMGNISGRFGNVRDTWGDVEAGQKRWKNTDSLNPRFFKNFQDLPGLFRPGDFIVIHIKMYNCDNLVPHETSKFPAFDPEKESQCCIEDRY